MPTNAVTPVNQNQSYLYETQQTQTTNTQNYADQSVFDAANNQVDLDYACTDGSDDGIISADEMLTSAVKGIGKMILSPITEAVKGNFVPLITTAIGIGVASLTGPAGIAILGAVGLVGGGVQLGSGIINAFNADSDGEAKKAFEQIGQGGFAVLSSAVAVKGGLKQLKAQGVKESAYAQAAAEGKGFFAKAKGVLQDAKATAGKKLGFGAKTTTSPDAPEITPKPENKPLTKEQQAQVDDILNEHQNSVDELVQQTKGGAQGAPAQNPDVVTIDGKQIKIDGTVELSPADEMLLKGYSDGKGVNYLEQYKTNLSQVKANATTQNTPPKTVKVSAKTTQAAAPAKGPESVTVGGKQIKIDGTVELSPADEMLLQGLDDGQGTNYLEQYKINFKQNNTGAPASTTQPAAKPTPNASRYLMDTEHVIDLPGTEKMTFEQYSAMDATARKNYVHDMIKYIDNDFAKANGKEVADEMAMIFTEAIDSWNKVAPVRVPASALTSHRGSFGRLTGKNAR